MPRARVVHIRPLAVVCGTYAGAAAGLSAVLPTVPTVLVQVQLVRAMGCGDNGRMDMPLLPQLCAADEAELAAATTLIFAFVGSVCAQQPKKGGRGVPSERVRAHAGQSKV